MDHGVSGAKDRRPALDRLMADARRCRFDVVACAKFDRLARSVHHLISLAREFEALKIDLIAPDQAIDTSTPAGRLLFHVLGSIAEFERDLIRERTVAGMRAAKRREPRSDDRGQRCPDPSLPRRPSPVGRSPRSRDCLVLPEPPRADCWPKQG